ncbi:sulfite exporter TauE/SafE family protein [Cellvibrio fontiphilus]|jgi:hypothetical protein|uniref:Sulfite exporter TauE/SafE family protein n=1 Tax=Cellvibrio fontiphilus TaxID=1815559 RepID=A0ABV7FFT7_9GAMM
MNLDFSVLTTAFFLGLFSSAHCIGMCGGIMGALSMAIPADARRRKVLILSAYNLGRVLSYVIMGVFVGLFSQQLIAAGGGVWLRWLAGLLLIAMGLYLASWWRGLVYLEAVGRYLWVYLQPIGKRLMPVTSPGKGLFLGMIWGWLPCGLVYSALAYSMAQGNWVISGLSMLAFGFGTLPSLMLAGLAAQRLHRFLQMRQLRWAMAVIVILFGLLTIWGTLGHDHSAHNHSTSADEAVPQSETHNHEQHQMHQGHASSSAQMHESHEHHHH